MKPISERSHEERLAVAYWWGQIGRGLGVCLLIPVILLLMSLRWAAFALVPCGTAFVVFCWLGWRRWKSEGFYYLGAIKRDDRR